MKITKFLAVTLLLVIVAVPCPSTSSAWYDETHLAIAKVTGYEKWFNAAGPDLAKLKMGDKEGHNHFVNNPRGTVIKPEMVLAQVERYNQKGYVSYFIHIICKKSTSYLIFMLQLFKK